MDWKVVLVIFGSVIATGLRDDILDLEHTRPNHFSNVRWLDKPNKSSRKRYDRDKFSFCNLIELFWTEDLVLQKYDIVVKLALAHVQPKTYLMRK